MSKITAEQVQLTADADTAIAQFARTYTPKVSAILNDPAIRRLVVEACVEDRSPFAFYPIPAHEILTILCPTEAPDA